MVERVRITGCLFKNLLCCIVTRSLDACSGVLVGWNVGLRLKALRRPAKLRMCSCSEQSFGFVSPISAKSTQNHANEITEAECLIKQLCKTVHKET